MGTMTDAADPANIPAALNGTLALRTTVLADEAGQAFDIEAGNAPVSEVVRSVLARRAAGKWSILYYAWNSEPEVLAAVDGAGIVLASGDLWPDPQVYLWLADPSHNIARGLWLPRVRPLAVQDGYQGATDTSTTLDNFPARVAGYIDGARYAWPPAAWARFVALPDAAWHPDPSPAGPTWTPGSIPSTRRDRPMYLANDGTTQYTVSTDSTGARVAQAIGPMTDPETNELAALAGVLGNLGHVPAFLGQCRKV